MTPEENLSFLAERLQELGFHKTNMHVYLDGCAASGMDTIPYYQRNQMGDDEMAYELIIKRNEQSGLYYPDSYTATLLKTHPIEHVVFGKIDSRELEQRLKVRDWTKYEGWPVKDRELTRTFFDVFELQKSRSKKAQDVANRLMLRYWRHTPVEQRVNVNANITGYQTSRNFPLHNDRSDYQLREAYNLMCGRAVMKFREHKPNTYQAHWEILKDGKIIEFPDFDLGGLLRAQPIRAMQSPDRGTLLILGLLGGELQPAQLIKDGEYIHVSIAVDVENARLIFYDEKGTEADVNNLLNPKPAQRNTNTTTNKKTNQKRRGRSL